MKRIGTLFALLCLVLFVALAFGQQTQTQQQGKPKMVIEQSTFDAGAMYRGGEKNKIEHVFIIKNTGTANLQVFKAQPG